MGMVKYSVRGEGGSAKVKPTNKCGTEHSRSLKVAKERSVFNFNPFASPIALAEKSFVNSEERIIYHQVDAHALSALFV